VRPNIISCVPCRYRVYRICDPAGIPTITSSSDGPGDSRFCTMHVSVDSARVCWPRLSRIFIGRLSGATKIFAVLMSDWAWLTSHPLSVLARRFPISTKSMWFIRGTYQPLHQRLNSNINISTPKIVIYSTYGHVAKRMFSLLFVMLPPKFTAPIRRGGDGRHRERRRKRYHISVRGLILMNPQPTTDSWQ
jgi:hypothetical protein